jgi:hypothetical protein
MENRKPLNFAQALRSKPGRLPEPDAETQSPEPVDAHRIESQTPTAIDVDAQASTSVDAHLEDIQTPIIPESGRPHQSKVDARTRNVDANASTQLGHVDAKLPTSRRRGRTNKKTAAAHKSDRHRTDLVRQHFRVPPELDEKIRLFRAKKNLELQEFYQLAAAHLMNSVDAHKDEQVDALASLDDRDTMILFRTEPSIINVYLQYNPENRWKPADDYAGQRYNGKDIRLVEIGIIQTQFNARFKKVNSFKYYTTEIDEALAVPLTGETIDIMLRQGRRRWEQATGKLISTP